MSLTETADSEKQTAEAKTAQKTDGHEKTASGIAVKKADKQLYTTSDLNVRSDADLKSEILGVLLAGDKVQVTGTCENDWVRISFKEKEGFVSSDYLSAENKIEKTPSGVVVTKSEHQLYAATGVYVRSDSNSNGQKLGILDRGDAVQATGLCENGWIRVTYNGTAGYIYGAYLSKEEPEESDSYLSGDSEDSDSGESSANTEGSDDEEGYQQYMRDHYPQGTGPSDDEEGYQQYMRDHYPQGTGPSDDEEGYQQWVKEQGIEQ